MRDIRVEKSVLLRRRETACITAGGDGEPTCIGMRRERKPSIRSDGTYAGPGFKNEITREFVAILRW